MFPLSKCRRVTVGFVVLVLLLAGGLYFALKSLTPAIEPAAKIDPRAVATLFAARLADTRGHPQALADWRGKVLVVNFWASWCPPCTKALPVVSRFVAAHRDVAAIGLAVMQPKAQDAERFASEHDPGFPLAWLDADATQRLTRITGKLVGIPFTWLIAPDGTLHRYWYGGFDAAQLEQIMREAGYPKKP